MLCGAWCVCADNYPPHSSICLHQDALRSVVISHKDWELINEGTDEKPKKG